MSHNMRIFQAFFVLFLMLVKNKNPVSQQIRLYLIHTVLGRPLITMMPKIVDLTSYPEDIHCHPPNEG